MLHSYSRRGSREDHISPSRDGGDSYRRTNVFTHQKSTYPARARLPYNRGFRDGRERVGYPERREQLGHPGPRPFSSHKDCRVYVGNLAFEVRWHDLKDFMREAGEVVFADILTQSSGRSKGCGVVEFRTSEEARKAIYELNDKPLMGRPVFIREDRETEAKFGSGPGRHIGEAVGRQVFVSNLPYNIGWQDLKDLFREAGSVIRADLIMGPDRRPKGQGTVLYEFPGDAEKAISMFNGYEWQGRRMDVREDRFASGGDGMGPGGYRPPPPRGSPQYGRPPKFNDTRYYDDHGYNDYHGAAAYDPFNPSQPDSYGNVPPRGYGAPDGMDQRKIEGHGSEFEGGANIENGMYPGPGNYAGEQNGYDPKYQEGYDVGNRPVQRTKSSGQQIYITNLPYNTTWQDLKDLFVSCGVIVRAEIFEQGGYCNGSGIVRFDTPEASHRAIAKFNGYLYGGRKLEIKIDRYA
ncbi:RNA-binding domain-containing protein [Basidiobolus meristosporus CBS 931.73]|uniref:RNA-binding domain-containing protein n=1 Tax=Basidiobolus meristosporus CBS 931.73 TaxID=1314790 RepID=A0A1Y1YYI4_9FUNG|nr:RNA-binding domain-containing protein [Basidiobolus meristosporus CBS 931.73]|eukprot:ORY03100.1 RNA-binding domain-containing protein [Basidiobolus meristosporus CBS 931.73]